MSRVFVILLGLFVLANVGAEEESPVSISQSVDLEDRTAIHEDLKPNDVSRTINIKILNSEQLEQAISESKTENEGNLKRSADTESPLTGDIERTGSTGVYSDEVTESKVGDNIEIQERSESQGNHEVDSRNDFEAAMGRVAKSSDDNLEPSLPDEVSRKERLLEGNYALESVEIEGKSAQDAMLETKGRAADIHESLEEVKAVSDEDLRTYNSPKSMDSQILRRSDMIIPNYFKTLSRGAFPYSPIMRNLQNTRPPYFGRLTNPIPSQSRLFENDVLDNTRRTSNYPTESDQELKFLEEYTDPDSNAYPYIRMTSIRPIARIPSRNEGLQPNFLDTTNLQYLPQLNPYSNEFSPVHYAPNYPHGVNALTRFR